MAKLSVVVPAINEERGIRSVLERLSISCRELLAAQCGIEEAEIIVVDDGSTDRTAEAAGSVPGVRVLSLPENRGYGAALKAGFASAGGEWLAFLDADGTYPPEFLGDLARAMRDTGADIVVGSRFAGAGSRMPLVRRAGNRFFARLLGWIIGRGVSDTASGMRMFKRSVLPRLDVLPDGLNFTPAMSASALLQRLDIREIGMPYDERVGRSKLNPVVDGLRFLWTILSTAHRYNPLKVFGALGIAALLAGLAYGAGPVAYYVGARRVEDWMIYRLVAVMVLEVAGINIAFFGLVANVVLAAAHRTPPFTNSLLARALLKPWFIRHVWAAGVVLMFLGPAINWRGIWTYFSEGKVWLHWSYTVTGALLFLLGLSIALWGSLVRVVYGIRGEIQGPEGGRAA
ncbi:MAG: glycosyltransferase family 2 protein [Deltaproteobacteria bacterium]|nr:glycosyltransferase family 2 protein [Deltaproteobacteria bacterium]